MGNCQQSSIVTHDILVSTGDKKGAGAQDVNVFITFTDENGRVSQEIMITNIWKNDFRKGKAESFSVDLPGLTKVTDVCIRRDKSGKQDVWYVEMLNVTYNAGKSRPHSVFPIHRWIHAEEKLCLSEFDSSLPQDDKNKEQRQKELQAKRELYVLSEKIIGAPPQNEVLPEDEVFSQQYEWDIASIYVKQKIKTTFIDLTTPDFTSLQDFESIFTKAGIDIPTGIKNWKSDEEFGNQKLAGCNPGLIRLCDVIPEHLAMTFDLIKPHIEGKSLNEALTKKKLYIIDLRYLAEIECGEQRKLPGPTCLLYVKNCGDLVPIAIQLMPEPAADNPVFTPSDPEYTWLAVKMWFNMAEGSDHESAPHLCFTHLLMDSVATCANRQLSPSHPVFRLLAPHFLHILAINASAVSSLVSPGGWVDKATYIGRIGMFNIIKKCWAEWNLKDKGNFLVDLQKRGVDDTEALPNYHYRDDATLLWNAISRFVSAVITKVYDTTEKLTGDDELNSWCKELTTDANFKGLPQTFTNTDELTEVLTVFIFSSSVGHAAVNFGQYNEYAFSPNYPSALRDIGWPTSKEALTEEYIVRALPPKEQALDIVFLTRVLSQRGTNPLAEYETQYAHDPIAIDALKTFRAELKDISATIDKRNAKRLRKYVYLNPQEIPNSISI